jgi:hypothetical protein
MSYATLLVHLAVLGMPATPAESNDDDGRRLENLSAIERQVSGALRLEAVAKDQTGQEAAIRRLANLHQDLGADPRFETSRTLKQLRMKIRARLRRVEQELSRDLERQSPGEMDGARGGRAQQANNGQALVELIQTTISPDSWDVNGGQSTIVYFAPRQVLVVRAPGEVHSRTRRLLRDMR